MNRICKYLIIVLACCALVSAIACSNPKDTETENTEPKKTEQDETKIVLTTGFKKGEVFKIGETSCYLWELKVYLTNMQNHYEKVYGPGIWDTKMGEDSLERRMKDVVIARVAQIKTMNLLGKEHKLVLSEEGEKKAEKAAADYFASLTEQEKEYFEISQEKVLQLYIEYAFANEVYDYIIQDVNPEISDDEARTITVKQILIKTYSLNGKEEAVPYSKKNYEDAKKRAQEIHTRAVKGEDFELLAQKYNEDNASSYSFGKGELEAEFEEAAFNLATDEISDVIETSHGFHIIKCVSTFNKKETDANKLKIVEKRKNEAFNKVYDEFLMRKMRNLNHELWDSLVLERSQGIETNSFFDVYNKYFE